MRTPMLCRLGLHHTWRAHVAEDGTRHQVCRRCGKTRPDARVRDPRTAGPASGHISDSGQDMQS